MRYSALIAIVLFVRPLAASPPSLPEFVQDHISAANLNYEVPRGQFENSLRIYFDQKHRDEPWAILGDFNGDNTTDWAGMLRNRSGLLDLVVVYSVSDGYSHKVLSPLGSDDDGIWFGVEVAPPGEIQAFGNAGTRDGIVILSSPGIAFHLYEKSSVVYYWDDGTFRELWTGD